MSEHGTHILARCRKTIHCFLDRRAQLNALLRYALSAYAVQLTSDSMVCPHFKFYLRMPRRSAVRSAVQRGQGRRRGRAGADDRRRPHALRAALRGLHGQPGRRALPAAGMAPELKEQRRAPPDPTYIAGCGVRNVLIVQWAADGPCRNNLLPVAY